MKTNYLKLTIQGFMLTDSDNRLNNLWLNHGLMFNEGSYALEGHTKFTISA